ncbi:MAG: GreA/GreB family elongation factor [Sandaracinaceae bacterium]
MANEPYYMTPAGFESLARELAELGQERQRVVSTVADAAAEGDRSENAEYIYGKKRLREIDKKMRRLQLAIDGASVVDPTQDRGDKVFFGARVTLEDEDGGPLSYQLVGEHEADAKSGRISYRSPVARALMGKSEGDEVEVRTPGGTRVLTVIGVRYG